MAGSIFVPVHLSIIVFDGAVDVLEPDADFSRLPGSIDGHEANPDTPYLSAEILRPDFEPSNLSLSPGVHLHWILPQVYRRGFQTRDRSGALWHPQVPNRWLVSRLVDGQTPQQHRHWIVESDYLSHPRESHYHDGVTIPLEPRKGRPSFARLGRCIPLDQWLTDTGRHERLQNLTVLGYGNPAFAAFYPNCRTVFGFHDPMRHDRKVTYQVLGWHSAAKNEPLRRFGRETRLGAGQKPNKFVPDIFGWAVDQAEAIDAGDRVLCFARAATGPASKPTTRPDVSDLAIGHTGTEALSALLASKIISPGLKGTQIEDQLEAAHLASGLDHRQTDRAFKVTEARHEKGFSAIPGGTRWTVQPRHVAVPTDGRKHDVLTPLALPPRIKSDIAEANRLQRDYDELSDQIESLRKRIFHDWHRYMEAMYRNGSEDDELPDVDRIRRFMEDGDLAALAEAERRLGVLSIQKTSDGQLARAISRFPRQEALSSQLAAALTRLQRSTAMVGTVGASGDFLGNARFDQPDDDRARLVLPDGGSMIELDFVEGLSDARLTPHMRLRALTVSLSIQIARGSDGVILSFGAQEYFEIAVRQDAKSAGKLTFTTQGLGGPADVLASTAIVDDGKWQDVIVTYDGKTGDKKIIANKRSAGETKVEPGILGGGSARIGQLGNASDKGSPFHLSISHLCIRPTALSEKALASPDMHKPMLELFVRPSAGARYWTPREPVILLTGPAARQDQRFDKDVARPCHRIDDPVLDNLRDANRDAIRPALDTAMAHVQSILGPAEATQPAGGEPWYAFALEWEVAFRPYAPTARQRSTLSRFDQDLVLESFKLPATAVDLSPDVTEISGHASVFTGRSILTKHAKSALLETIKNATTVSHSLKAAKPIVEDEGFHVLSQALSGFNDALIQTRQGFQLPVADPLAFDDYRLFSEERVRSAVGRSGLTSPSPQLGFHPLRAGIAEILRLRLVDTFGRVREIDLDGMSRATGLHHPQRGNTIVLRPRITQPARLNFRWLASGSNREEASEIASDNPICGWITPDFLDHALFIHDADGQAMGRITQDHTTPWREPVGQTRTRSIEDIGNPHLRRVVRWLNRRDADFRAAFVNVLHQSLVNIHPDTFANHSSLAFLMGRPLAIVRAKLSFSLKGLPATHQGWIVFRQDLHRTVRDSWGFGDVLFPVRLGEHRQVNDGLLGYWLEEGDHALGADFFAPNPDAVEPHQAHVRGLAHPGEKRFVIPLSLSADPVTVTMLIDPRAQIHATTGILPVKSIGIPPGHFEAATRRMEFSFPVSPILTPRETLTVPLPRAPGFDVSWIARRGNRFQTASASEIEPHEPHKTDTGVQELVEGWMHFTPRNDKAQT